MYEKFGFKYATNVLGSLTLHESTGATYNTYRNCIPEKSEKCCIDVLCTWVTLTDFQILGCKLYQNVFGGQAEWRPGAGGAIALPQAP